MEGDDKKANYDGPETLLSDVKDSIPRGIAIIRHHRLLGQDAQAEVKLDQNVEEHTIGGRADFIMTRVAPHRDKVILDGKGSKWRDQYVDARQLLWYAMLYQMRYGHAPDKLGFVFWRFDPDKSLDWVDFTQNDLDGLKAHILETMGNIEGYKRRLSTLPEDEVLSALVEMFPAQPGDKCRLCSYLPVCKEGQGMMGGRKNVPRFDGTGTEDVGL